MRFFNLTWLKIIVSVLSCSISLISNYAQTQIPEGRRFRDIVQDRYPGDSLFIGATSHLHLLSTNTGSVLGKEVNYVTPANKFKQSYIHPEPGIWRWKDADAWVAYARKHNQIMRLHAPISPQSSSWIKQDFRTAEELKQMLEEYTTALCKRYNDTSHIKWLDVVNEIVALDGAWFGPAEGTDTWENPWPKIGYDTDDYQTPLYIKYAFEIADSLAPDLKLIINQHGSMEDTIWDKIKHTVLYLRNQGLRVDGIGWQAHVDAGWEKVEGNIQRLKGLITWAHENNLEFHVTENNSWIRGWEINTAEKKAKRYTDQAETFAAIVRVLIPYRKTGVVTWNLWHLEDDHAQGYQWEKYGCMWSTEGDPKPAYYAVQRVLEMGEDSGRYSAAIQVLDQLNDSILSEYHIILDGDTTHVGNDTEVVMENLLPGIHRLQIIKDQYDSYQDEYFYVYKDSIHSIQLSQTKYNMEVRVLDAITHTKVAGVEVFFDSVSSTTGSDGSVTFKMLPGTYPLKFEHAEYASLVTTFSIKSDTVFTVYIQKTIGDIKIVIANENQPVNNVMVKFGNTILSTNARGEVFMADLKLDTMYRLGITHDAYKPYYDSVFLVSDTILNITIKRAFLKVGFCINITGANDSDIMVTLNEDTAWTSLQECVYFYGCPVDSTYKYKISTPGYAVDSGIVKSETDTTINIELQLTNIKTNPQQSVVVYPNPADDMIWIDGLEEGYHVRIYSMLGKLMVQNISHTGSLTMQLEDMPAGSYVLKINPPLQHRQQETLRILNIF